MPDCYVFLLFVRRCCTVLRRDPNAQCHIMSYCSKVFKKSQHLHKEKNPLLVFGIHLFDLRSIYSNWIYVYTLQIFLERFSLICDSVAQMKSISVFSLEIIQHLFDNISIIPRNKYLYRSLAEIYTHISSYLAYNGIISLKSTLPSHCLVLHSHCYNIISSK